MPKQYKINEIFYSIQGEGVRTGTANVFVRFTGCNMKCDIEAGLHSPGGFACDTEFESGRFLSLVEIVRYISDVSAEVDCHNIILTGGEPALQADQDFCNYMHNQGYYLAIETNGSIKLHDQFDWITVSPKVAEHAIKQLIADEVKYVRGYGQAVPKTRVKAKYKFISPAFDGLYLDQKTLDWCIKLVKENPEWRLSTQDHKAWTIR